MQNEGCLIAVGYASEIADNGHASMMSEGGTSCIWQANNISTITVFGARTVQLSEEYSTWSREAR